PVRHEGLAAWRDVAAVDDRRDDRRVGRRAADAELLELLDQARLGVARGRRGLVALRVDLKRGKRLAFAQLGQLRLGGLGWRLALLVLALLVGVQEPAEGDDRAARRELGRAHLTRGLGRDGEAAGLDGDGRG